MKNDTLITFVSAGIAVVLSAASMAVALDAANRAQDSLREAEALATVASVAEDAVEKADKVDDRVTTLTGYLDQRLKGMSEGSVARFGIVSDTAAIAKWNAMKVREAVEKELGIEIEHEE